MRKIILVLCCVMGVQFASAQRSSHFISSDRLFYEGKEMFNDRNYAGCIDKIKQYQKQTVNPNLNGEVDYFLIASNYYQGYVSTTNALKDFLENHPTSIHCNEVAFMIGSTHFAEGEYEQAIFWLKQSELDYLTEKQQEDYAYRMAFSAMKTGDNKEAFRLFSLLKINSITYRSTASYYLAYLYYTEKDYNQALVLFNQLKDNQEFRPEVLYYISQINFVQKRYAQTISEGLNLLSSYPNNKHNVEINRIIGISYYYEENHPKAINYLNQFVSKSKEVAPKDYYILGSSYYMQNEYSKAIEFLSLSQPENDELGQSIYLLLGQSYLSIKDNNNALMAFGSASRMDYNAPAKEAAMYNYAMLLHQNSVSAFGESVTVLENFLNTYPNSIYSDKVNDALVDVYLTTKDYQTALTSIAKIKNPGNKILEARQKIYYYLGTVEFTNNNYTSAIDYFTKAIGSGNYAPNEKNLAVYWRGESHYKVENYTNAINDYKVYLQTAGNNLGNLRTLANYNLAYSFLKQGNYSTAETYFKAFIEDEREKTNSLADAHARLGDCYFHSRRFSEAEKAYNQAIATVPSTSDYALFQKGFVMGLLKNYKGKITQMDNLVKDYPNSPYVTDALYEKGRAYIMLDNNPSAIETYQILLNKYPNSSLARKAGLQLGLLHFNSNQSQKAATAYKNVIAKYPGSDEAKVAIQDLKSVYVDMNDIAGYADYVRSLDGSVKFDVTEQDSLTYLVAERFFTQGNISQAQSSMKNYLQSFPAGAFSTNAHYYLANTYYQQKNYEEAKREYSKVLEAGDTKFTEEAVARTAELQYKDKEYANALHSYERLQNIAESKANREVGSLGVIRSAAQLNNYNSIISAANLLLKDTSIDPEIAEEARFFRAKAYLELKERSLAVKDLETLAKDTRTAFGAEAKYLLAQHHFDNGSSAEAKSIVQNYIQQGTPHQYWLARSFILLADIYIAENDKLQAQQYLESLQNNYKNTNDDIHTQIRERLASLN